MKCLSLVPVKATPANHLLRGLAKLLDHEMFAVKEGMNPAMEFMLKESRREIFLDFYASCVKDGIDHFLTEEIFQDFGPIKPEDLEQAAQRSVFCLENRVGPILSVCKILIVDDRPECILDTAGKLVGCPNVIVDFWLHPQAMGQVTRQEMRDEKKIAQAILERHPNIVLMDQGLHDGVSGSQVILEMRDLADQMPIIVANTGGEPIPLYAVGALTNCNKGEKMSGVIQAFRFYVEAL